MGSLLLTIASSLPIAPAAAQRMNLRYTVLSIPDTLLEPHATARDPHPPDPVRRVRLRPEPERPHLGPAAATVAELRSGHRTGRRLEFVRPRAGGPVRRGDFGHARGQWS